MDVLNLESLKKIRLFKGMQDYQLELISHLLQPLTIPQGEYIIKEQTTGDQIFILLKGQVRVTKELIKGIEDHDAGEKQLATLSCDFCPTFGENGLLGKNLRSANVIAMTECQLYTLTQKDFDEFAENHPNIAYVIMKNIASVLSERLITTDDNVVKLATALFISVSR
jgi:CRP-like cAMP-binding protein